MFVQKVFKDAAAAASQKVLKDADDTAAKPARSATKYIFHNSVS